jgi:hypothetical protein
MFQALEGPCKHIVLGATLEQAKDGMELVSATGAMTVAHVAQLRGRF